MVPPIPRLPRPYNDRDTAATWRLPRPVVLAPGLRRLGTLAVAGVLDGRHQLPVARCTRARRELHESEAVFGRVLALAQRCDGIRCDRDRSEVVDGLLPVLHRQIGTHLVGDVAEHEELTAEVRHRYVGLNLLAVAVRDFLVGPGHRLAGGL